MSEETVRTRIILDEKIEERLPLNYDAIQELAEKTHALNSILFKAHWGWYKSGESKYVKYFAFHDVLNNFYISIVNSLLYKYSIEDIKAQFLAYRLLFNLICNDTTKLHVCVLNEGNNTKKAWELFNRSEYLINNFETEILLPDTGDTEDVGY